MSDSRDNKALTALARQARERCDLLAGFSEEPDRLTRTFLSAAMHSVHQSLTAWMKTAGMIVRTDALGNLIGRFPARAEAGKNPPVFLFGSHLDTVPDAGRYDGVLGVLLALAAVELLAGRSLPFALDVIGFSEEEGVRFRHPYLGSLAVAGQFDPGLLTLQDGDGITLAEAIHAFGQNPADTAQASYDPARVLGYFEAHIEQGPVLEERGLALAVVQAIAGQSRLRLKFLGQASHAGTTPMGLRRDAFAGACEFALAVEAMGRSIPGLAATVGAVVVSPNAANVIPGTAAVSLDVRHAQDSRRQDAVDALRAQAEQIAARRGLGWQVVSEAHEQAVPMSDAHRQRLAQVMAEAGYPAQPLVSGAGHDAVVMARLTPPVMLFLRSPGGLSHHPDEQVIPEDVEAALEVMHRFLLRTEQEYLGLR